MNKQEFLRKLEQSLRIKAEEKGEVMRYYTEYFEEAGPENEQAVLKELGDPRVLAEKLNAECTTRSVFTTLKDIFGGGRTEKVIREFSDLNMEPFHAIRVDVENCPVTVTLSENDQYGVDAKFVMGDQDEWEINVVDGTLMIKKHSSRRIRIQFGFSGNDGQYVRIYLPKVAMDIVELISSNASIQVEGICAQTLIAETSNAVIRTTDTKILDELKADTSNGSIDLEHVSGRILNADTSNGAIRINRCEFEKRLLADTSNGSIEVQLTGSESEYSIHADTSNAKVYVNGQVRGDEYHSYGGAKEVRLDTSNSRITIRFVSRS